MIRPYIECINIWTGKNDIFMLAQNPSAIDYMKKYRKLVGFFKTDPLHSDLKCLRPYSVLFFIAGML